MSSKSNIIDQYLSNILDNYLFQELEESFYNDNEIRNLMKNIPVPIQKNEFCDKKNISIKIDNILKNIVLVLGVNKNFKYANQYKVLLYYIYKDKLSEVIMNQAKFYISAEKYEEALAYMRLLNEFKMDSDEKLFYYAMACRGIYLKSDEEDVIGTFKAETMKNLEKSTLIYPDFLEAYYFLGYSYLNMGLYSKANETWKIYVEKTDKIDEKKEIISRLEELKQPVNIEKGCNLIISGRYTKGIEILKSYVDNNLYEKWWPINYYYAIGLYETGKSSEAVLYFKKVLSIDPSNLDTMMYLVEIYKEKNDKVNETKYVNKIQLIMRK